MRRSVLSVAVVCSLLLGCGDDDGVSYVPYIPPTPSMKVESFVGKTGSIVIVGTSVERSGSAVTTATVDINGTGVAYDPGLAAYFFTGTLSIAPGDDTTITVTDSGQVATATLTMPEQPTVLVPNAAGSPYDASSPVVVQWSALSPAPDTVEAELLPAMTASGAGWSASTDGANTQLLIPGGTLVSSSTNLSVVVQAVNQGNVFSGDVTSDSILKVTNATASELFSTQ